MKKSELKEIIKGVFSELAEADRDYKGNKNNFISKVEDRLDTFPYHLPNEVYKKIQSIAKKYGLKYSTSASFEIPKNDLGLKVAKEIESVLNKHSIDEEYKRDYAAEYTNYHSKPEQKKNRAKRNAARRKLEQEDRVSMGDGKDVDHKNPLRSGGGNSPSNLRVRSKSSNRADNGHKKGE